jgi:ribosomal protein L5
VHDLANPMTNIYLDKVVLNIGIGSDDNKITNAKLLLKKLASNEAAATLSKKRDPSLKIRKNQIIGAMVTVRGKPAEDILIKTLDANDNLIKNSSITVNSLNFGVKEYIDVTGIKYDSKIGMLGFNVNASFARKGKRVQTRKKKNAMVGRKHNLISREDLLEYLKSKFNVRIVEE